MKRSCIVCGGEFETAFAHKTCSDECRKARRQERRKISDINVTVIRICKFCSNEFKARRYKVTAFCNKSCASKFYIQDGTYDNWRLRTDPKEGITRPCDNPGCTRMVYVPPRITAKQRYKYCSRSCFSEHIAQYTAGHGTMRGKKLTAAQKAKQQATLLSRYGVKNAYQLAVHRNISGPQMVLYELVCDIDNGAEIEQHIQCANMSYYADILIRQSNKIIELYGDYWHCNPSTYAEDYFHAVKGLTAAAIWEQDRLRNETLRLNGYTVMVVWDDDLKHHKELVAQKLKEFLGENSVSTKKA